MKLTLKKPSRQRGKTKAAVRTARPRLPSFADAAKRVAGMIEGSPDLSMCEGFGPKLLR